MQSVTWAFLQLTIFHMIYNTISSHPLNLDSYISNLLNGKQLNRNIYIYNSCFSQQNPNQMALHTYIFQWRILIFLWNKMFLSCFVCYFCSCNIFFSFSFALHLEIFQLEWNFILLSFIRSTFSIYAHRELYTYRITSFHWIFPFRVKYTFVQTSFSFFTTVRQI